MNLKIFSSVSTLGLGLLLSLVSLSPTKAEIQQNTSNKSKNNSSQLIITQLLGHQTYMGEPQIEWGDYLLGRVVGKSGGIMFIGLEDGTSFTAVGSVPPGSDVLVLKNADGSYSFVQGAKSEWISILESKYGYKRLDGSYVALNERTAALWKALETSSSSSIADLPPRQSTMVETQTMMEETEVMEYQETSQPIRGLW